MASLAAISAQVLRKRNRSGHAARSTGYIALLVALLSASRPVDHEHLHPGDAFGRRDRRTGADSVQLTTYMLGFAVGQPIHGPLGDRYGHQASASGRS